MRRLFVKVLNMKLKVMTFNIQHGRNHNLEGDVIDLDAVVSNVTLQKPDIVGLNEVRSGKHFDHFSGLSDQPAYIAEKFGYNYRFGKSITIFGDCEYGNAVFSKFRILNSEVIAIPDPDEKLEGYYYESRSLIRTDYEIEGKRLTVLNSHFGLAPNEQTNAVDLVFSIVKEVENPVILMGDFNMTPENENVKRLSGIFEDVHRSLNKAIPTYPSNSPDERIDYIFVKGLKVESADTVKKIVSDHYAITAVLEF